MSKIRQISKKILTKEQQQQDRQKVINEAFERIKMTASVYRANPANFGM